jgi:hypothetical protein
MLHTSQPEAYLLIYCSQFVFLEPMFTCLLLWSNCFHVSAIDYFFFFYKAYTFLKTYCGLADSLSEQY